MSIFVDENTKVIYQGVTGSQGKYYANLNRAYGTQVVGGTNPKKAGTDVDGIPVFANVAEAVQATGATSPPSCAATSGCALPRPPCGQPTARALPLPA